jgi:endonuclease YncB( thermonuclease family)
MATRAALGLAAILWMACTLAAVADTLSGRVVRVADGDTIEVLDVQLVTHRVRLAGIDAAESGQDYGSKAKQRLTKLVGGRDVQVLSTKRDKYGRIVGKVIADGQDVNLAMIRAGAAWWYRKYREEQSRVDQALYEAAEDKARHEHLGLWANSHAIPPWEWRHRLPTHEADAAACPCGSGAICVGKRGGRYCLRENGTKKYLPAPEALETP